MNVNVLLLGLINIVLAQRLACYAVLLLHVVLTLSEPGTAGIPSYSLEGIALPLGGPLR